MSVFFSSSSDTYIAAGLMWQMGESLMSALFTGWLNWCRNFDSHWWFHFCSSHQLTFQLIIKRWEIRPLPRWLLSHRCHQPRNNNLTFQDEETTSTCEFNGCTVKTAQKLPVTLYQSFDASVHQPRGTHYWTLHIDDCEPSRSSCPWHKKSTVLLPLCFNISPVVRVCHRHAPKARSSPLHVTLSHQSQSRARTAIKIERDLPSAWTSSLSWTAQFQLKLL